MFFLSSQTSTEKKKYKSLSTWSDKLSALIEKIHRI